MKVGFSPEKNGKSDRKAEKSDR